MPRKRNFGKNRQLTDLELQRTYSPYSPSAHWIQKQADEFTELIARWRAERSMHAKPQPSPDATTPPPVDLDALADLLVGDALKETVLNVKRQLESELEQHSTANAETIDTAAVVMAAVKRFCTSNALDEN